VPDIYEEKRIKITESSSRSCSSTSNKKALLSASKILKRTSKNFTEKTAQKLQNE
jgi:hypothetical protein